MCFHTLFDFLLLLHLPSRAQHLRFEFSVLESFASFYETPRIGRSALAFLIQHVENLDSVYLDRSRFFLFLRVSEKGFDRIKPYKKKIKRRISLCRKFSQDECVSGRTLAGNRYSSRTNKMMYCTKYTIVRLPLRTIFELTDSWGALLGGASRLS